MGKNHRGYPAREGSQRARRNEDSSTHCGYDKVGKPVNIDTEEEDWIKYLLNLCLVLFSTDTKAGGLQESLEV